FRSPRPLELTARQGRGGAPAEPGETGRVERLVDARADLCARDAAALEGQRDVVGDLREADTARRVLPQVPDHLGRGEDTTGDRVRPAHSHRAGDPGPLMGRD